MNKLEQFLSMVTAGVIMADVIHHARDTSDLIRQVEFALDERCHICGYKYQHPIVKHLGKRGVECGWR